MSVLLKEGKRSEAALVAFTLFVPAAVGIALTALFFDGGVAPAWAALALASAGMAGSVGHLAKPLRAPLSLANIGSSWLSREIAAVSVFWGFLGLWLIGALLQEGSVSLVGRVGAAASGVVLLAVIARAYQVSTRPAWCGPSCLMELASCSLGAGSALFALFADNLPNSLWMPGIALATAGIILDVLSHRVRRARLEALREESDERVPLTLQRYSELRGKIRTAWAAEIAAVALAATSLWWIAAMLQLLAHGLQRAVFYDLPVQVRYVARLRK